MTIKKARDERLQIMVSLKELKLVDDFPQVLRRVPRGTMVYCRRLVPS
jgi:hypothetical protein